MTSKPTKRASRAKRGAKIAGRTSRRPKPTPDATGSVAAQILGARKKIWNAGVNAFSRSGGLSMPMPRTAIESFQGGIKKLEEVFDQRVLSSLARAGMPSPGEIAKLKEQVAQLQAELERLRRKHKG
jgi:hypothetical protein